MTMELVIDGLAIIGGITCLYGAIRVVGAFLGWVERSEIERQARETAAAVPAFAKAKAKTKVGAPPPAGDDIPPDHLAAIAAAVTMLGDHRVVLIQDNAGGQAWTSEGRWLHQTSHRPH